MRNVQGWHVPSMTRSPILTLAGILVTVWCVFELFKWHYISARTVRNPYGTRIYLHSPLPPSANGDVHAASALLPGWAKGPSFYFEVLHDPSKATKRGSILDEAVASLECDGVILLSGTIPTDIRSRFTDNHILYASRHRYCALRLTCQNDGDFRCVNYHFWRYLAAWRLMNMKGLRSHARILMLDTDAIFTNVELSIPTLLSRFSSIDGAWTFAEYDPSVVVSADASCYMSEFPINSGVVILKNSPVARMAMYLMMQLSDARDFLKNRRLFGANMLQDQPILVHVASDRLGLNLTSIQEYCNTFHRVTRRDSMDPRVPRCQRVAPRLPTTVGGARERGAPD
eukprot:Polyplicarium_translucidae@DN2814_c0_g1_i2.p1